MLTRILLLTLLLTGCQTPQLDLGRALVGDGPVEVPVVTVLTVHF